MTTTKEHKNNNNKIPFVFPLIFCLTAICSKGSFAVSMYPEYEYTRKEHRKIQKSEYIKFIRNLHRSMKEKQERKKKSKESHNIIYKMCPTIFVTLKLIY